MEGIFSLQHWIIVLVIALVIFGPKRMPEIGRSLGKGIREFKSSVSETADKSSDEAEGQQAKIESKSASSEASSEKPQDTP